jgi:hypothetical protein
LQFQKLTNDDLAKEIRDRECIQELLASPGWQFVRSALEREQGRLIREIKTISPLTDPTTLISAQAAIKTIERILALPHEVFSYLQELLAEKEARVIKKEKNNSLYLKIHNIQ